jgi:hypothetical protein
MKKLVFLTTLFATASLAQAQAREWKAGTIVLTSENVVSWPLWGEKDILHYTIETSDMIYFVDYTYKPGQHNNSHGPDIALNVPTKIAIAGNHAYILDTGGKEVKLHIAKKTAK